MWHQNKIPDSKNFKVEEPSLCIRSLNDQSLVQKRAQSAKSLYQYQSNNTRDVGDN